MEHKEPTRKRRGLRIAVLGLALAALAAGCSLRAEPAATPSPVPTDAPTPAPSPTPAPTPTPVPELSLYGQSIPVTAETLAFPLPEPVDLTPLLEAAPLLTQVRSIDLSACTLELDALGALRAAYPAAEILCQTQVGEQCCDSQVETLDFSGGTLELAQAELACRVLPRLTKLIFPADCGYTDEELDALNRSYPDTQVVWSVHFGTWTVRTDATCFSTLQFSNGLHHRYTSEDFSPLFRYCRDLVALDLGHNDLDDMTELAGLTKLKVLILADDWSLSDISPLAALTELEYLEIFNNPFLSDFSALHSMTKMLDMNLSYCPLSDLSFLEDMPALERCWLRATNVPSQQWSSISEAYPDVEFLWYFDGPIHSTIGGWREFDRNVAIRTAFKNWQYVEDFVSWDNVRYTEGAPIIYAQPSAS